MHRGSCRAQCLPRRDGRVGPNVDIARGAFCRELETSGKWRGSTGCRPRIGIADRWRADRGRHPDVGTTLHAARRAYLLRRRRCRQLAATNSPGGEVDDRDEGGDGSRRCRVRLGGLCSEACCQACRHAQWHYRRGDTTSGVARPGYRQVDFHGLAIDVQSTWPLDATQCGHPVRDTVVLPGPVPACAGPRFASVSSVEFVEDQFAGLRGTLTGVETGTFSLDGERATRLTGRRDTFVVAVIVPAVLAQVVISSPSRALARSRAATLTLTGVDSNGCPSRAANTSVVPTGSRPSRPGAADVLIPATPSQIAVCRYVATRIEQSTNLNTGRRASFVAALNALPQGLSRTDINTYLPELCRTPPTSAGSFGELDAKAGGSRRSPTQYSGWRCS